MTMNRPMPPLDADERPMLEAWLDFYRGTLAVKCEGLEDAQLRSAMAPPSPISLLGLVQHMAEVERNWFRRVLVGENVAPIYDPTADPSGDDGGFDVEESASYRQAAQVWNDEIAVARRNCASRGLDDTSPFMGAAVSLRWIYLHMTAEYARHCGHADIIRERIDGATGI